MSLNWEPFMVKLQISFSVRVDIAAKFSREEEGHADDCWVVDMHAVSTISTASTTPFLQRW